MDGRANKRKKHRTTDSGKTDYLQDNQKLQYASPFYFQEAVDILSFNHLNVQKAHAHNGHTRVTYLHQINHQIGATFRQNNGKLPELRKQPLCSVADLLGNGLKQDFTTPQGCVHLLVVRLFVDLFQFFVLHIWGQTEKDGDHPANHSAVELCDLTRKSAISTEVTHTQWVTLLTLLVCVFQGSGGKRE